MFWALHGYSAKLGRMPHSNAGPVICGSPGTTVHVAQELKLAVAWKASGEAMVRVAQQIQAIGLLLGNAIRFVGNANQSAWGKPCLPVGAPERGKIWLLASFLDALPTTKKRRYHFRGVLQGTALHCPESHSNCPGATRGTRDPGSIPWMGRVLARTSAIEPAFGTITRYQCALLGRVPLQRSG